MAETLGMLCDKLTIIKLKQYHTEDSARLKSLQAQASSLQNEIDEYVRDVFSGRIPIERLTFEANKVYKESGNEISVISGNIGQIISHLADVNCKLWHEQEKVYDFENVPVEEKNSVVKKLAILNLERNKCIDLINQQFREIVSKHLTK